MAACGTQEHFEARRKERKYYEKAYMMTMAGGGSAKPQNTSSYDQQVQFLHQQGCVGGHDKQSVDSQRRQAHYDQMKREYSAKLPNRYSNFDFTSQW